ncbi:hypothetical protein HKD37_15G042972 [Glycine soja]
MAKKHIVDLPYEKDFREKQIPTKARPIQMNEELLQYCQKETKDLLDKGLIRKRKSPRSCTTFYANKQVELEWDTPRLAFKIVETDASDIGYGGILKQRINTQENNISRTLQTLYLTILPMNSYREIPMTPRASDTSLRGGKSTAISQKEFTIIIWELLKNPTLKQTKTDYAFLIQTLLALQEIGLTKLPKKAWVDIASESNDESEIDLKTLIQKTKEFIVVCNISKGEQTLTPTTKRATPAQKSTNAYIYKNNFSTDKNPFKAITKMFPSGFHFKPTAINKTRTFYEFILIDSNSVSIKHFKDSNDQSLNTHSTIQILKVMQPRQFGPNLHEIKFFSVPFDPRGYTYWDYMDAWTKTNTVYNFSNWFLQWWDFLGPILEIYSEQESRIPADLKYFSNFALSWIVSWQYRYNKTENNKQFPSLQRHAFFDTSKAEPDQVKIWFEAHLEFLKAAVPETSLVLNQKSQLAAFLAGSNSKEHLTKNLKEVLKLLQSQEEGSSSSKKEDTNSFENGDDFHQNEDDCFDICLDDI